MFEKQYMTAIQWQRYGFISGFFLGGVRIYGAYLSFFAANGGGNLPRRDLPTAPAGTGQDRE